MKILHLIDSAGLYGAEVMLLHLIAEQIKQGLQPIIASIGEKGIDEKPLEKEAKKRGYRVEKFRMAPGPNYLGALNILRFAWHEGIDILHSHGYKGDILFGFIPGKIRRIPIITTVHGYTSTGNGFSRMRAYEWLDSKALRFMDTVVFVSNAMKSDPRFKHLNPSKVHVIHNGIPLTTSDSPSHAPSFSASDAADLDQHILHFCTNTFTLGSIGRLSPEKGYIYLIKALKIIRDKGHDVRLVIIGEGGERPKLETEISRLGLNDHVLLPGYRANASSYLPYFDVFVLPSLTEGLPMTILEAMRAGIPIIASGVGGIPEIMHFGKGGVLANPGEVEHLAEAAIFLWHQEESRRNFVEKSKRNFYEHYTSQAMAVGYRRLYRHLMNSWLELFSR